jgi:hypothetical protein
MSKSNAPSLEISSQVNIVYSFSYAKNTPLAINQLRELSNPGHRSPSCPYAYYGKSLLKSIHDVTTSGFLLFNGPIILSQKETMPNHSGPSPLNPYCFLGLTIFLPECLQNIYFITCFRNIQI